MEFRDALKLFRSEVGLAQTDIATALHINITTVGRWEQGKTVPSRSFAIALLDYAKSKCATSACIENLEKTLRNTTKEKLFNRKNSLFTVEHATISQIIEDAAFPIYVCGLDTDEILYANHATEQLLGKSFDRVAEKKCFECIMGSDKPHGLCQKNLLEEDRFSDYEVYRHVDGRYYRVFGKLLKWNGRPAQVRYAIELDDSAKVYSNKELRCNYEKQIALRRKYSGDALAVTHYNLTRGTGIQVVECQEETIASHLVSGNYEDVINALSENTFSVEDKVKFDSICKRDSLIKYFFQGKTHISIKHLIKGLPGYYEGTFDLMQNPASFDVEAYATLRNITPTAAGNSVIEQYRNTVTI